MKLIQTGKVEIQQSDAQVSRQTYSHGVDRGRIDPKAEPTFRAVTVRVGDVAGQAHMQRAAEALVMGLCRREGRNTVAVVELPTQWNHAALHPVTGLLTHKAGVDT